MFEIWPVVTCASWLAVSVSEMTGGLDFLSRVEEAERRDNGLANPQADPTPKYAYAGTSRTAVSAASSSSVLTPASVEQTASASATTKAAAVKRNRLEHRVHDETGGAAHRQAQLAAAQAAAQAQVAAQVARATGSSSQRGPRAAVGRVTTPRTAVARATTVAGRGLTAPKGTPRPGATAMLGRGTPRPTAMGAGRGSTPRPSATLARNARAMGHGTPRPAMASPFAVVRAL